MLRELFNGTISIMDVIYLVAAVIIALSFHEWAHAFSAYKLGDTTARDMGRMTIDPTKHLDPIGFLCMLFVGFGWAKPVPVNPSRVKGGRWGEIFVSAAGVLTNFVLALISGIVMVAILLFGEYSWLTNGLMQFFSIFASINLSLIVFNLIPLPPLDGYRVLKGLLIGKVHNLNFFWQIERYGWYVLIAMVWLLPLAGVDIFSDVLNWGVNGLWNVIMGVCQAIFGV